MGRARTGAFHGGGEDPRERDCSLSSFFLYVCWEEGEGGGWFVLGVLADFFYFDRTISFEYGLNRRSDFYNAHDMVKYLSPSLLEQLQCFAITRGETDDSDAWFVLVKLSTFFDFRALF